MKIRWRGHASFIIETGFRKIITDPFNETYGYPVNHEVADFVTVSHEHGDHNATDTIAGKPRIIRGPEQLDIDGISFKGIASFHDMHQGRERGPNIIFKIMAEGIDLVHLGDLGQMLSTEQVQQIGNVDILLIPVGGRYTIDAGEAYQTVSLLQPKVVIPMHYGTPHLSFELAPLEKFTARYDRIIKKPSLDIQTDELSQEKRVVVLDYL
jgi:L-ascorbate metabolism protein UlaG (beta-lactamase superfamily)